jgi:hypothetical protein
MSPNRLRDSWFVTLLSWALAIWAILFSLDCVRIGDKLTSAQWVYLMSVPGGKWFWAASFGVSGLMFALGLRKEWHRLAGLGSFLVGALCVGIAMFYLLEPIFDTTIITLGYWPWAVPAGLAFIFAASHWKRVT